VPRNRERPINPQEKVFDGEFLDDYPAVFPRRPSTAMEALLEAPIHREPERSREDYDVLRETLGAAIDGLPEDERTVFEGIFMERATFRVLAERLDVGVATIDRLKERALALLQAELDGKVDEWLN